VKHWVFDARDFPPARTPDLPAIEGSIPALLATPFWPPRAVILMEFNAFRTLSKLAGRPTSLGGCMTINKSGLEIETKDKTNETEGKFRGDPGKAAGDTSERVNGRAEEAIRKIQKDFGKTERKV
jgi:uncharacterized protein YjbJ (UPF0337 family)